MKWILSWWVNLPLLVLCGAGIPTLIQKWFGHGWWQFTAMMTLSVALGIVYGTHLSRSRILRDIERDRKDTPYV